MPNISQFSNANQIAMWNGARAAEISVCKWLFEKPMTPTEAIEAIDRELAEIGYGSRVVYLKPIRFGTDDQERCDAYLVVFDSKRKPY